MNALECQHGDEPWVSGDAACVWFHVIAAHLGIWGESQSEVSMVNWDKRQESVVTTLFELSDGEREYDGQEMPVR